MTKSNAVCNLKFGNNHVLTRNYFLFFNCLFGGRRGRDHMVVRFTTTCAIGAYTNEVVVLNPAQGEEYNIIW